jgi:hypothetical protein
VSVVASMFITNMIRARLDSRARRCSIWAMCCGSVGSDRVSHALMPRVPSYSLPLLDDRGASGEARGARHAS